jgi:putative transposase
LHRRSGHLWQNRFYSCPLDDAHLVAAMAYVERNPVRAGMVKKAWDYPWSSAKAHADGHDESGLLDMKSWLKLHSAEEWRTLLSKAEDKVTCDLIRSRTFKGRPLGSDSFISKLETTVGKRLRAMPVGRPKAKKVGGNR